MSHCNCIASNCHHIHESHRNGLKVTTRTPNVTILAPSRIDKSRPATKTCVTVSHSFPGATIIGTASPRSHSIIELTALDLTPGSFQSIQCYYRRTASPRSIIELTALDLTPGSFQSLQWCLMLRGYRGHRESPCVHAYQ